MNDSLNQNHQQVFPQNIALFMACLEVSPSLVSNPMCFHSHCIILSVLYPPLRRSASASFSGNCTLHHCFVLAIMTLHMAKIFHALVQCAQPFISALSVAFLPSFLLLILADIALCLSSSRWSA